MRKNIYDFDGTIYDGDSSIDFYKYCFKKKKSICKYWLKQVWYMLLYFLKIKTKTEMKQEFFCFLKDFKSSDKLVKEFWESHKSKIKDWYLQKDHKDDIIISASPEFLLKIPAKELKVFDLMASDVDIKTGIFKSKNCHDKEKVKILKEKYPNVTINEVYTDSLSDLPLLEIAKKGFIVKKDKIIEYQKN